jgi:PAS domain S-box-containing protein
LLLWGVRLWPAVWIAAFTANALTQIPLWAAAGIATGNTLEAIAAAVLLPLVPGFDPAFRRTRAALIFIVVAVLASPVISASIGVTMLCSAQAAPWARFIELWREWWLGDALGALVVAPAILTTVRVGRLAKERELEAIGLVALTAVTTQVVSGQLLATPFGNPPLAFVIFPFVIVAAARLGQPATSLVIFTAASIIILNTLQGYRPFGAPTIYENLLLVHVFMGVLACSGLILASAITERRVLERRRAATYAAGSAIAGSSSVEETAARLLGAICSNLGWRAGGFWLIDPKADRLRCVATWPDGTSSGFLELTRQMTFERGTGLPGRVWATGEPAWIEDVVVDPNFPRAAAAKEAGLHGGFAFPIRRNAEFLGVVEFFSESIAAVDYDLLATMGAIGYQIGDFLRRTQTEAAVVVEQTRTRAILESALDAIISIDHRGRVTEFNGAAERMFGYSRTQAIGQELATLIIPKALRDGHRAGLATYLLTGVGPFMDRRVETTAVRSDGSEFPVEVSITKVMTDPPIFTGFVRDVTDRARLERERHALLDAELAARREAEAANRAKDEFLATLSHELRTPLNAIVGWTRMLLDGMLDEESARRALTIVDRNAHAQAQLVTDLLDVSRIITGKLSLNLRPLDLGSVVGAALDTVRPAAEAKRIRITTKISSAARLTTGDFQRLQQVAWNLLSNAIKFTPEGGTVDVQLMEHGPAKLRLTVTDSGIGIAPQFLPHVFDRFRQADGSSTRQHGGLGLGLAIVRHLVEQHGGTVSAESAGPGKGATFVVELPQSADHTSFILPSASPSSRRRSADGEPLIGCDVVVLEDEEDAGRLVEAILTKCGAAVRQANSVDEALGMLKERPADVVLADVGLPGKDGYDFVRGLRALEGDGNHTYVAAVTAYARIEDRDSLLAAGFDAHIPKPVEPRVLVDTVVDLWRNRTRT